MANTKRQEWTGGLSYAVKAFNKLFSDNFELLVG